MIAVDTNVLIRFLTRDDETQHAAAEKLLGNEIVFIPDTVILETEWVLRFSYRYPRDAISFALRKLLGLPNIRVADQVTLFKAIEWHEPGMDFADALHLAASRECDSFVTFDADLIKRAGKFSGCRVHRP